MMKTHNKLFAATMIIGLGFTGFSSISTADTLDGVKTGDIEIKGTIGKLDNTDPTTEIPEGFDDWINVTLDTATAFHTTTASKHKDITSATYSVENNSGRGVAVYVEKMTGTPKYVKELRINPQPVFPAIKNEPTSVGIVNNGQLFIKSAPELPWLVLANKNYELEIGSGESLGKRAEFNYLGESQNLPTDAATKATNENYTLTLRFVSIQANGEKIGR
ncbi:hypothetical protein [Enterococcus rivorum]|nr:hypothetical protein [Enterococcus rivorum]MBP2097569.1 hypothetical protein [Enterococcus rivorum]